MEDPAIPPPTATMTTATTTTLPTRMEDITKETPPPPPNPTPPPPQPQPQPQLQAQSQPTQTLSQQPQLLSQPHQAQSLALPQPPQPQPPQTLSQQPQQLSHPQQAQGLGLQQQQSPLPPMTTISLPPPPPPPTTTTPTTIALPTPPAFLDDLNFRLGRANGNVYHRRPGLPQIHDGQIMVRLKKKRFIVIDYGLFPPPVGPGVVAPPGAGREICGTPSCPKVGVPVLLYDSVPDEPASLYLRSGLCFTCQRALNEKRRTQRKRKGDIARDGGATAAGGGGAKMVPGGGGITAGGGVRGGNGGTHGRAAATTTTTTATTPLGKNNNLVVTNGPRRHGNAKRYKSDDAMLRVPIPLPDDAVVIAGPMEGVRLAGEDYPLRDIGRDVKRALTEALCGVNRLCDVVASPTLSAGDGDSANDAVSAGDGNNANGAVSAGERNSASDAVTNDGEELANPPAASTTTASSVSAAGCAENDVVAIAAAAAAAAGTADQSDELIGAATTAIAAATMVTVKSNAPAAAAAAAKLRQENVVTAYNEAMKAMKRGVYLLNQWKVSFDATHCRDEVGSNNTDTKLKNEKDDKDDLINGVALETAAAPSPSSMIPLLLAAEVKGHAGDLIAGPSNRNGNAVVMKREDMDIEMTAAAAEAPSPSAEPGNMIMPV